MGELVMQYGFGYGVGGTGGTARGSVKVGVAGFGKKLVVVDGTVEWEPTVVGAITV